MHGLSKVDALLSLILLTGTFQRWLGSASGTAVGDEFSGLRGWYWSIMKASHLFSRPAEMERTRAGSFGVERMNLMLLWYFLPSIFGLVRLGEFVLEACGLEPQGGGGRWSLAGETGQR